MVWGEIPFLRNLLQPTQNKLLLLRSDSRILCPLLYPRSLWGYLVPTHKIFACVESRRKPRAHCFCQVFLYWQKLVWAAVFSASGLTLWTHLLGSRSYCTGITSALVVTAAHRCASSSCREYQTCRTLNVRLQWRVRSEGNVLRVVKLKALFWGLTTFYERYSLLSHSRGEGKPIRSTARARGCSP